MKWCKAFLAFSLTLGASASVAQEPVSFTSDRGLSNTCVRSITEDSRRNVWIATQSGLNRYDGVKMNVYRHGSGAAGSLGHDMTGCVLETASGKVLVGMENGVQSYSYDTDRFTDVPIVTWGGDTIPAHVISMSRLGDGSVYVCVAGYGVYRLRENPRGGDVLKETRIFRVGRATVLQVFEDARKRTWIVDSDGGIWRREGKKLLHVASLPGAVKLCQSSSGRLYLATERDGLLCYGEEEGHFRSVSPGGGRQVIASVNPGAEGQILICTDGGGLKVYDEATGLVSQSDIRTYEYDLSVSNVKDAIVDSYGNTWVGVYWKGVLVMPGATAGFDYAGRRSARKNTIGTDCVTFVTGDGQGDLWLAADHQGVYRLARDGSRSVHFKPGEARMMPSTVMSMLEDSEGTLWLGSSWSGVVSMDKRTGECTRLGTRVPGGDKIPNAYALAEDAAGNVWIGTMGGGLFRLRLSSRSLTQYGAAGTGGLPDSLRILSNPYVRALLVDGGVLYAGTADGLETFTLSEDGIRPRGRYLRKSSVRDMKAGAGGVVWAATSDGLVRFDAAAGRMRTYTVADGLPVNSTCSVEIAPDGKVWTGTDDGLSCFDPKRETFRNYHVEDGLQGNEFGVKASFSQGGILYFGGTGGLTMFRPSDVERRRGTGKTELRLVDFYVGGRPVHAGDRSGGYVITDCRFASAREVNLSHRDKSFSIELCAGSFSGGPVTYSYSINGGPWTRIEHGRNIISFVNMDAGTYRVRMKAEARGVPSPVRELTVRVHPVWYLSPQAFAVYALLLLLACYVAVVQIREHLKARRILSEHRRTEELNEARIQFFMNISHEIRTPMTLILNPVAELMKKDKDEGRQRSYRLVWQNAQRILRLVDQLMDVRKIEKGQFRLRRGKVEMVGFVSELYGLFEPVAATRGIAFSFTHGMERLEANVDARNFDKVVMNLLSNAFKFTPDGGAVAVELAEEGAEDFVLSVTDSGAGIPDREKRRVFERFYSGGGGGYVGTGIGLNLAKLLVELHGGDIRAEDNPAGKGTRFVVRMPRWPHVRGEEAAEGETAADSLGEQTSRYVASEERQPDNKIRKKGGSRRGRILVVEDDEGIRRYLSGELAARGYEVAECRDGREAWEYVTGNAEKVDLVLSDVMMPEMDGVELCRKVRENYSTSHIPVVLLTAKDGDADHLEGLTTGADAYLSKPFNMDILLQTVDNLTEARRRLWGKYESERREGEVDKIELTSPDEEMMRRVMKVINGNLSNPDLSVEFIADKVGISRVHFHRRLKEATGLTPRDFVRNIRMSQAARLLSEKNLDITSVAVATGFKSISTFSTCFKAYFGIPPTEYARKNAKDGRVGA